MANFLYSDDLPSHLAVDNAVIAVDSETMGLNNLRDRLCLVQLSFGDGDAHLVKFNGSNYDCPNLKKLLSSNKNTSIFHFARFDVAVINHYLKVQVPNVYCTKIASKLCRTYSPNHGLKDLCQELLSVKISKMQQSSDWGNDKLSEDQINYAASDVLYLHKIKDKLDMMLKRESRDEIAKQCFDFISTRAKLDLLGWSDMDIFSHSSKG